MSWLALAWLTSAACHSEVLVGSGCKDGVCPLVTGADACVARITERAVRVSDDDSDSVDPHLDRICLPHPLVRDANGIVAAHVLWVLPSASDAASGAPSQCADWDFLRSADPAMTAMYQAGFPNQVLCEMAQLPVSSASPAPVAPTGAGFFYDDFSSDLSAQCATPRIAVSFTETAAIRPGVIVYIVASEMLDANGDPSSGKVCRADADATHVGDSCVPTLSDYDVSQSVLETRVAACGGGPCLAYHVNGHVGDDCVPGSFRTCDKTDSSCPRFQPCVDRAALAKEAFCTCRCDAPDKSAELCTCADGFSCEPIFELADSSLAGSYCVRSEIFSL
jgi:hypothetical protein